jgi:Zn-dependent protease
MDSNSERSSGWSVTLGAVIGIPIRIHFTFLLLLIWYGYYSSTVGHDLILAILFLILLFVCVVLHELGHAAMARRMGVRTREIVLYPIGGIARLENIPAGRAELFIALAGPAVNLVLATLLGAVIVIFGSGIRLPDRLTAPQHLLEYLFLVNVVLLLFNLLPAFPMDGGRVLRAALAIATSQERATEIAAAVGQATAILFAVVGILQPNALLMIIALFVFIGASQEAMFYRQRSAIVGKPAHEAMIRRFETLAPQDSLQIAAEHLLATHQQDFPVLDAWNRVVGILSRARLMQGLARHGGSGVVLDVMERDVPTVAPDDDLARVLQFLRARPQCPVLVLEEERLSGMITLENLTEFIEVSKRA